MKKKLAGYFLMFLLFSCCGMARLSAQAGKKVMKVTIPGYPTFVCTNNSLMPIGDKGGVVTIVKNADNLDQQFDAAMKNKTPIATLDLVEYTSANGQLTKNKTFYFTKLVVQSLIPNLNKVTAVGFSFENMVQK